MTFGKLIGVFLLAAAAMNILFLTWFPIEDNDIWWLLAAGREMVQSGGILKSDVWSCTINGQSWLNKYIPFEILVYMLYAKGGANALIALRSFFALLSAAAMFGIAALWGRRENSPALNIPLAASLLTLTGLLAAPRMFVRPELCSLVCFAIAVCLWENQRGKNLAASFVIAIVFLQIIWTNLHSAFILGYIVAGAYILESSPRRLWILPLLILSSLANPFGFRMLAGVLDVMRTPFFHNHLWEWLPLFHRSAPEPLRWLIIGTGALTLAGFALNRRRLRPAHILLFIFFFWMVFKARRHGGFFALSAAAANLWNYGFIIERLKSKLPNLAARYSSLAVFILLVLFSGMIPNGALFRAFGAQRPFGFGINRARQPWDSAAYMKSANLRGNLFNGYDCGGFLIWMLAPDIRPCIDSRAEPFPPALIERHYRIIVGEESPDPFIEEFDISLALIDNDDLSLLAHFNRKSGWRLIFSGYKAALFQKADER